MKNDFEKDFFELIINAIFEKKQCKMWENIEILNLSQQKEEKLFGVRTKLPY